jgi:hypothetical protein
LISTFIGIAVHNATTTMGKSAVMDFAAGVRQDATGLLGTTLLIADLVSVDIFAFAVLPKTVFGANPAHRRTNLGNR